MFSRLKQKMLMMNLVIISLLLLFSFGALFMITSWINNRAVEKEMGQVVQTYLNGMNNPQPSYTGENRELEQGRSYTGENMGPEQGNTEVFSVPANVQTAFIIEVDKEYDLIGAEDFFVVDQEVIDYGYQIIVEKEENNGKINYLNNQWQYKKIDQSEGYLYVFMNTTGEKQLMNQLFVGFIAIYVVVMVLVFIVSRYLTNQSTKPIQRAFEKQEQFIWDASHELKSPLAVISANVDVVLGDKEISQREGAKWLGYIKTEVERMTKLTSNLLELAHMDSEEEVCEPERVNLSTLVEHHILGIEVLAFEKKYDLISDIEENISFVGNKEQLSRLVFILLDNALKYTKKSGDIIIKLEKVEHIIQLKVGNLCDGLSDEQCDKIFDRFYRVDKARNRSEGSYGLGLSIAKNIVDNHGGKITCSNKKENYVFFEVKFKVKGRFKKL